uniref:hypothetical protein n=1 Tax=Agathobacter sp. TaxID=2021311 RepID=UPI004055BA34
MAVRLNHRIHAAEVQKTSAAFLCVLAAQKITKREAEEEIMAEKEKSMVEKILDTERAGYAYFYPSDGGNRQEFFISTTPENMANFLGSHFYDAEKMIITDMVDRLILDTYGGFINTCPDQKLCAEIIPYLAPIQMGEKEAREILMVTREESDMYFAAEDQAVTMAECQMM